MLMSIVHATDERTIVHRASRLALAAERPGGAAPVSCENFRSEQSEAEAHAARPS
jgi:hypothetical protein